VRAGSNPRHSPLELLPVKGKKLSWNDMRGWREGSVGVEEVIGRVDSDRRRDLPGLLEPADRLASSPVGHASVDEARLDVSMTEVILYEVDRLACVEKMGRHGMPHRMDVPAVGREIRECGVAGEEGLDPPLREPSLSADEESRDVVGSGPQVAFENRHERSEKRLLSRVAVLHPPDPNGAALEVDVLSLQ
jgi:hypothetical protein